MQESSPVRSNEDDATRDRRRRTEPCPDWRAMEARYGSRHYETLPVVLVRGEGVHVWERHGRRYLDMMSAYSAVSHGHCHPRILRALNEQAHRLWIVSRAYHNDKLPVFLKRLCEISGQDL